ncbi:putative fluoride ion transporter CrcB [bacterium MnTg02]|nr:putative fluoride ion transporter CrcB [bacterium MnTg02]
MKSLLLAAAGGAIGAAGRYVVGVSAFRLFGPAFPWGTFIVNVTGCFAMGILIESLALKYSVSNEVRTFLATGILGGFTTFSAFALDFAVLLERKSAGISIIYLTSSVCLSVLALFAGLVVARAMFQ